ncbi:MAG: deoxyribose-phosphate aldolase [Planctomycetes bacterium]|nr:deoxyribose-phosphate aldolase [Planctomycetota bacterium]
MSTHTPASLAACIDHTLLKPEAAAAQIDRLCDEAVQFGFASVCVNPVWVRRCAARLGAQQGRKSPVVCTVVGFPLGASEPSIKAAEAALAVEQGAIEVDMVVNLAAVLVGDRAAAAREIAGVVDAARRVREDALIKVILETRALTDEQIILGCRCAAEGQADFVKTSTGFHPNGGATVEHVALMRKHAAPIRVKASGGIRDLPTALAMLDAGADRLGMSAGVAVIQAMQNAGC